MRAHLERIFRAGVEACLPERVLPLDLLEPPTGRTLVLAIGKAAAGMAAVAEAHFADRLSGIAVVPDGVPGQLEQIELLRAGHPIPDERSVAAAERLLAMAERATADDLVLVLLGGGASALACLPSEGLTLGEKQAITAALLRSGAAIADINCVRRHLSRIKGGRLALAARPAQLLTLAISDVPGDRPEDIGSGPTVADATRMEDAQAILRSYGIDSPAAGWSETPTSIDSEYRIVARNRDALEEAAEEARRLGYAPQVLGECEGEARDMGRQHAELALRAPSRTALISGGELTVRMTGRGQGGPNQEYALAAAIRLHGRRGICGLAADTDGIDGSGEAAGAFFDGDTLARSKADAEAALRANDSGSFFAALGDLLVTGPTGTNVNDLRIILTAP
jgi:glycerate 2-kinase